MSLEIKIDSSKEHAQTVFVSGSLDSDTSPRLQASLEPVMAAADAIIFDLAELEYISSAGLGVLFMAKKAMDDKQGKVLLVHLQPQVKKVFEIVKAIPTMSVFKNYDELDDYLDYMQRQEREKQ